MLYGFTLASLVLKASGLHADVFLAVFPNWYWLFGQTLLGARWVLRKRVWARQCQLQEDINCICSWASKWQLRLNPSKCEALAITRKRSPLVYTYCINNITLPWRSVVKYLRRCSYQFSSSDHCNIVVARATRCSNFLCHTIWGVTTAAKAMACKYIIRSLLQYSYQVWNDISMLKKVQQWAAHRLCDSRWVLYTLTYLVKILWHLDKWVKVATFVNSL